MNLEKMVSFVYGGVSFPENFKKTGEGEFAHADGLKVRIVREDYADFGAVEWTVWFENTGKENSRQLTDIKALDSDFASPSNGCTVLSAKGTHARIDDFSLVTMEGKLGETVEMKDRGSGDFIPFANVDMGGEGVIIGIGWTGHWFLNTEVGEKKVHITAGMPGVDTYLKPGEHVRSPRILVMPWKGKTIDAQNKFRRFMVAHHLPKDKNGSVEPLICCNTWGGMKTYHHLALLDCLKENDLKYDCYWMDAGWHGPDHECEEFQNFYTEDWAYNQGEWRVNRTVHPDGLMPISNAAHEHGMKFLLWCGAFSCNTEMGWYPEHPEWGRKGKPGGVGLNPKQATFASLYMDVPEAMDWLGDRIGQMLHENGADCYREDTGLPYGHEDTEGRKGIGEMKAVEAYYKYWDALLEQNPGLIIDNCGGGGHRIDLETLSRSYVFWRSDYCCDPAADPIGPQVGNYGLGFWFPMVTAPTPKKTPDYVGTYAFRSGINGVSAFGLINAGGFGTAELTVPEGYPIEWHRKMLDDFQKVKYYTLGDFYPLSGCDTEPSSYMAYQLDRPDMGEGCVMLFRRHECMQEDFVLTPTLDALNEYEFTDLDSGETFVLKAFEPLKLKVTDRPGSRLLTYKKI